jgi:HicA-like toxin of HicAB toxin-antitoxin system
MGRADSVLEAIFADPIRANVAWRDIEAVFQRYNGQITRGSGSRVRVVINGVKGNFHRPHPANQAHKPLIRSVRRFLEAAGITP